MKQRMSTNVITHWLEGWISQTHQMEINDGIQLWVCNFGQTPLEELKSFKFANVM